MANTTRDRKDNGNLSRAKAIARHFNDMTRSAVAGGKTLGAAIGTTTGRTIGGSVGAGRTESNRPCDDDPRDANV
jgi:hypothetical protein